MNNSFDIMLGVSVTIRVIIEHGGKPMKVCLAAFFILFVSIQSAFPQSGFKVETVTTTGLAGANSGTVASATNTTAETSICSVTLPASELGDNQELKLHCEGIVQWSMGPSLTITLRVGGTTGTSLGSFKFQFSGTQSTNLGLTCNFSIAANAAPNTSVATEPQGNCMVGGLSSTPSGALSNGSTIPWNTSMPQDITVDATWSAASASNIVTARLLDVVRQN
jgi:hypothetical protein